VAPQKRGFFDRPSVAAAEVGDHFGAGCEPMISITCAQAGVTGSAEPCSPTCWSTRARFASSSRSRGN